MERVKILTRVEHNDLTCGEAADALGISKRQLYRIQQRYRAEGEAGLVHRLRGRPSNKARPKEERTKALRLCHDEHVRFNPSQQIRSHQTDMGLILRVQTGISFNPSQQIRSHQTYHIGNPRDILSRFQSLSTNQVSSNSNRGLLLPSVSL